LILILLNDALLIAEIIHRRMEWEDVHELLVYKDLKRVRRNFVQSTVLNEHGEWDTPQKLSVGMDEIRTANISYTCPKRHWYTSL